MHAWMRVLPALLIGPAVCGALLGPSPSLDCLYRSARYTLARDKERSRFSEQWQSLVTPLIGPGGRELAEGSFREAQTVAVSHTLRAAYVYNPKAAHRSVKAMFRAASGKANCREPQPYSNPNPNLNSKVYTVIATLTL